MLVLTNDAISTFDILIVNILTCALFFLHFWNEMLTKKVEEKRRIYYVFLFRISQNVAKVSGATVSGHRTSAFDYFLWP
jgi:hypothetical protein